MGRRSPAVKTFDHRLSLNIDAQHVRISYVQSLPQTAATERRLGKLKKKLRELERNIKV